ncbi:hypothetical protein SAMD00019534_043580 [Acytostelium subglobosum LB1]|uniref:hypothetical protein n=1 Tax=Acytostelium subglobosum LB1 TaxID=1410327 RepID=UPI000644F6B4|nr:hypothetical protein SAMD00019534_043580 [Acytostelium subglobosum LB1]GAM21183.1 hypothetical protein SAMD00019534_043580 [Acytostelium subglobosum LB1]|eukprot:XP_012756317.1 hypothetical protein SAMD00019534_043580 [Acytostelium subglobosum LB1]
MGAVGKARVFLWTFTILIMVAGSLGSIIYNKPLGLKGFGNKTILGTVYWNAVIALNAIYLVGTGLEIISRAYLVMVGSTCSEQRRQFLCCFLYSMSNWWKLMVIMGAIILVIEGALTGVMIWLETFAKIDIIRLAITDGITLLQLFFSIISLVVSKRLQKKQDEEEEQLYGQIKEDYKQKDLPPATIKSASEPAGIVRS